MKRALDSGAHGIMLPMVGTAVSSSSGGQSFPTRSYVMLTRLPAAAQAMARDVISLSKFPPLGIRGFGSPFTQHAFGVSAAEYVEQSSDHLLTILQIESREGVDNIEEIAAVPGAGKSSRFFPSVYPIRALWSDPAIVASDVLFIGPFDLANSLNVKFGGEEHESAIASILRATKAAGKYAGIFVRRSIRSALAGELIDVGLAVSEWRASAQAARRGLRHGLGRHRHGLVDPGPDLTARGSRNTVD